MADIVNLKRARKEKMRAGRENEAAANRRLFGRTKAEKAAETHETRRAALALQGKRLEDEEKK